MRILELDARKPTRAGLDWLDALRGAWRSAVERPDVVVAGVAGGPAALAVSRHVVTVLDARAAIGSTGVLGWLERRQTRRSSLIYALDRTSAVAFALRWRLDLARIRIMQTGRPTAGQIERELAAARRGRASWHSA